MKTKNIRYVPGGGAEIVNLDIEDPGPDEVQIETAACGICSWDIQTFRTGSDSPFAAPPGHEGVGYVSKIGRNVRGFEIGQRVAGGGFSEIQNSRASRLYKIPESKLADKHWIVEPASCVVTGIDHCKLKAGERLAMVGCGFMGLMMLQGLKHSAADQLIALDVDPVRLDMAMEMGATEAHDVSDANFDSVKPDLISRGIDVVVDTSGAQSGLDLATDIVKPAGLINLFGWIKGTEARFNPSTWHGKAISIVNSSPGAQLRDPFPPAIRLIDKGIIDLVPLVTHTVPIDEFPSLLSDVTQGKASGFIKGVVTHSR